MFSIDDVLRDYQVYDWRDSVVQRLDVPYQRWEPVSDPMHVYLATIIARETRDQYTLTGSYFARANDYTGWFILHMQSVRLIGCDHLRSTALIPVDVSRTDQMDQCRDGLTSELQKARNDNQLDPLVLFWLENDNRN